MSVTSTRHPADARLPVRPGPGPRRRSMPLIAAGVLFAFGGALVFALAYLGAGHREAVLDVTQAVPAGGIIVGSDLGTVLAAAPGVSLVPASQRSAVIGKVAQVSLVPGSLLSAGQFGQGPAVAGGQAVVGIALKAGGMPTGLVPGEQVMIVDTGPSGSATSLAPPSAGSVLVPQATVFAIPSAQDLPQGAGTDVVSVVVPAGTAPGVAAAGAAGQVS